MSNRILCYGDSNTWGYQPEQPYLEYSIRYPYDKRWTGVLQDLLGDYYTIIEEGLNGRTTVYEDPGEPCRNGIKFIDTCLLTHTPLNLVIIMLGTNDLKPRICRRAYDSARGVALLGEKVLASHAGREGKAPKLLIISPITIGENIEQTDFSDEFGGKNAYEQSLLLSKYIKGEAEEIGCAFLDAAEYAKPGADAIHMDDKSHARLGAALAKKVRDILF